MKRQMIEALREENQRLEGDLAAERIQNADLTQKLITTGSNAVKGLVLALEVLTEVTPKTKAGIEALGKARRLLSAYGVPFPAVLKKEPKLPRRRRRKKK